MLPADDPMGVRAGKIGMKVEFESPADDPMGGRAGKIGIKRNSNILPMTPWGVGQDDKPYHENQLPYSKVPQVAGAGSQGTEPRSMIWDGSLTDRIRKIIIIAYLWPRSAEKIQLPPATHKGPAGKTGYKS